MALAWLSILPLFVDPFHPEKHGGEFRRVMFWEWAYKELWEIWTGIELALRFGREDYELMYGQLDYSGKTVLDVGADIGTSANFFLNKGASKVVAVEGNPTYFVYLQRKTEKLKFVNPILLKIASPNDFTQLLLTYKPNIAKIDCEGCETFLLGVPDHVLTLTPEYVIETHSEAIFQTITAKLTRNNYQISYLLPFQSQPEIKVVYAQ